MADVGESGITDMPAFVAADGSGAREKEKEDSGEARTELKKLCCGSVVANPLGCLLLFAIMVIMIGVCAYSILNPFTLCLNASFSDFQVSGSDIVEHYYISNLLPSTSFNKLIYQTINRRRGMSMGSAERRRMQTYTSSDCDYREYAYSTLYVFYYDPNGDDVLTDSQMEYAHIIEQSIKDFDGYDDRVLLYCDDSTDTYEQTAPESFLNYLFPTVSGSTWILDGNGDDLCCDTKDKAFEIANDYGEYGFFDYSFNIYDLSSKYLVSVFDFGRKTTTIDSVRYVESRDDLDEWVATYDDLLSKYDYSDLGVAYTDGDGLILYNQLIAYVYQDMELAAISLIFIFVVVYLYVRSLFLTTMGLIGVMSAFAPALFLYQFVMPGLMETFAGLNIDGDVFNIVNVVSLWVILGIGADDIFVFTASYRRAPLETVDGKVIPNSLRMSYAYREAGAAMFCTSFTTAFSFASLMFSTISPLPQFGFFMASLVLINFLFVMTWFPCCLQAYIWYIQLFMLCGCHCKFCNGCLAVPVAIKKNKKDVFENEKPQLQEQNSWVVNQKRPSARHLEQRSSVNDLPSPHLRAQTSENFYGAGGYGFTPGYEVGVHYARQLTKKLESRHVSKKSSVGSGHWDIEEEWSDCVNLYWAVQRYTGILLILFAAIITIYLGYCVTKVGAPSETAVLLPDWTNFGIVEAAFENMDVCDTCSSSSSSGSSSSSTITVSAPGTSSPTGATPSPVVAQPTAPTPRPTERPTPRPTTRAPTPSPTDTRSPTKNPTQLPTTKQPTTSPSDRPTLSPSDPTAQPSDRPSLSPTSEPTLKPTQPPTVNGETRAPTNNPTTPTEAPTIIPTQPSLSPTHMPSNLPTQPPIKVPTSVPSSTPTDSPTTPTLYPSNNPTLIPTNAPTFETPDDTSTFTCVNEATVTGEVKVTTDVTCESIFASDNAAVATNGSLIGVFIEGGLEGGGITGCDQESSPALNDYDSLYDLYNSTRVSSSDIPVHLCFIASNKWSTAVSGGNWTFTAPEYPLTYPWWNIALFVYDGAKWFIIPNSDTGENWMNFSIVEEYSAARTEELSLDKSVQVYLTFGGKSADNYEAVCGGGVNPDATLELDDAFDFYDAGTQRKALWMCDKLDEINDAIMYRTTEQYPCIWRQFYNYAYLGKNNSRKNVSDWPVSSKAEMNEVLYNWLLYEDGYIHRTYFGVSSGTTYANWSNEETNITWFRQPCYTQINENWGGSEMYTYYKKWENWMDDFNGNKTVASSQFSGFQYASNYVFMEVELAFLDGFYQSVMYTLILCTMTMVIFTWNVAIVLFVCLYIIVVVICVVGIYGAIGWEFGAIEVIAVPTVVGLSIDYALHVTHTYAHSNYADRESRAKTAVDNIGCSVFASAMTTISSMIVLYFAVVVIFSDLGWIVAATTSCGIFISIFICPPLLGYIGPERDQCHCRWCFGLCGLSFIAHSIWGKPHAYLEASPSQQGAGLLGKSSGKNGSGGGDVELAAAAAPSEDNFNDNNNDQLEQGDIGAARGVASSTVSSAHGSNNYNNNNNNYDNNYNNNYNNNYSTYNNDNDNMNSSNNNYVDDMGARNAAYSVHSAHSNYSGHSGHLGLNTQNDMIPSQSHTPDPFGDNDNMDDDNIGMNQVRSKPGSIAHQSSKVNVYRPPGASVSQPAQAQQQAYMPGENVQAGANDTTAAPAVGAMLEESYSLPADEGSIGNGENAPQQSGKTGSPAAYAFGGYAPPDDDDN